MIYCICFLVFTTKESVQKRSEVVEAWLYNFLLQEGDDRTVKYVKDKTFYGEKMEQELSFVDLRKMRHS